MISFHYVTKPLMYAIHGLVYHVRPFGIDQRIAGLMISKILLFDVQM